MKEALFYIAGAATVSVICFLWCVVSIERVRREREISRYAALYMRIQKQIDETRMKISAVKMQLCTADQTLDQELLRWKYEYLIKQEQWLIELMCGKREKEDREESDEM